MFKYVFLLMLLFLGGIAEAGGRILYVPLDDRPVCLDYSTATFSAAGWEVRTPPADILPSYNRDGNIDALYAWLTANASREDIAVVSADNLIYGGLVQSRTHNLSERELNDRTERFLRFKQEAGGMPVYAFVTIMRSARASGPPAEPDYYVKHGPALFRLGALRDKSETERLSRAERKELALLEASLPKDVFADYYGRREMNLQVTERLLYAADNGGFDYLLLGRDDTANLSEAHREARRLSIVNAGLKQRRARFLAGADQLGILLLNRAVSKAGVAVPIIYPFYAEGTGASTVPSYEDETVGESVRSQILASGGWPARRDDNADLVLAVSTPEKGRTLPADDVRNTAELSAFKKEFLSSVEAFLSKGKMVGIADVCYANGSDNALAAALFDEGLAFRLASYAGWNTASNTVGFALVQGVQATGMSSEERHKLLLIRYLDEWAYQSNVRLEVRKEIVWPNEWCEGYFKPNETAQLERMATYKIKRFLRNRISGKKLDAYKFSYPWNRTFEIKVEAIK